MKKNRKPTALELFGYQGFNLGNRRKQIHWPDCEINNHGKCDCDRDYQEFLANVEPPEETSSTKKNRNHKFSGTFNGNGEGLCITCKKFHEVKVEPPANETKLKPSHYHKGMKMEPPEKDWEKEFEILFVFREQWEQPWQIASETKNRVKSFIFHQLKRERQKVARKIGQAMVAGGLNIKELTDPKEYAGALKVARDIFMEQSGRPRY